MNNNLEKNISLLFEEARKLYYEHNITGALKVLEKARQLNAENLEVLDLMANCYFLLGDFDSSRQYWERMRNIDSTNENARERLNYINSPSFQFWLKRYYDAITRIENKDYRKAEQLLRKLMEENDNFITLYQLLGLCYLAFSEYNNAKRVWKKGLELDTSNELLSRYLNNSIKVQENILQDDPQGKTEISFLKKKNIIGGIVGLILMGIVVQSALFFQNDKNNKATIAQLQEKMEYLSRCLQEQSKIIPVSAMSFEEDLPEESINNEEESEEHYYYTGYNAYLLEDWDTAIYNLTKVVDIGSNSYINREGLYYLARTYYLTEKYEEAEKYYLNYLNEFPDSNYFDDSLYYLGLVYYYSDRIDQAKNKFMELKEFDPNSGYTSTELFNKLVN